MLVRDIEDSPEEVLSNKLVQYKESFLKCDPKGVVMVYICKLFSIQGLDIQGYPCGMICLMILSREG